jgi:glycine dehydrogenase subunit 1
MMDFVGVRDLWDLYDEVPEQLKFKDDLDIPPAILDEYGMSRHIDGLLGRNISCKDYVSFLGAGCAGHYITAVVDEITTRGEFLTCYGAESWADHGKYQTFVEYNSMLAELLDTEVLSVPQYDGGQALATGLCMANRINGRSKALLPMSMDPQNRRVVENYLDSVHNDTKVAPIYYGYDEATGAADMSDLKAKLGADVAAVVVEAVNFFGVMEPNVAAIGELAKSRGAEYIAYVDPLSLGVLEAPPRYGATIVCGDLHSLGLHLSCGNGQAGFLSTQGEEKYLVNYKDFIYGFCTPEVEGEYVFGNLLIDRTHYARRAKGTEFTGTGTNLWMVSAAVYMALMGPKGFEETGKAILAHTAYARKRLSGIKGVSLPFSGAAYQEIVVDIGGAGKTVAQVNKALLGRGIFGGFDLSADFPQLGQSALYCFTEVTGKQEIDLLAAALADVLE